MRLDGVDFHAYFPVRGQAMSAAREAAMPWISVTGEGEEMAWREWVTGPDFESEHFRRGLADRLAWAVADAAPAAADDEPRPGERRASERFARTRRVTA
jgi:hypothetical protein